MSLSARKSFFNDRLSFTLGVSDLWGTEKQHIRLYSPNYLLQQDRTEYAHEAYLTVRYKFNAARSKYKGTGAGQSERNRL